MDVESSAPVTAQRSLAGQPTRVRIQLHPNTYSADEQSRRVAEVIARLRTQNATDVTFYIGADPGTPSEAIDRLLEQLRASGYVKTQVQTNAH